MNQRIPIGIVGLSFGRNIIDQLATGRAAQLFRVAAVCDHDFAKADVLAVETGAKSYHDFNDLLADDFIRAVGIFTGPVGRAALIKRCIRAGKDVITTKPFETDAAAALGVLQEAERLGRVVHLNSPAPLLPPDLAQIQSWRDEFQLGRPIACRAEAWVRYREEADNSWYDDAQKCPVAPLFRLGIYLINDVIRLFGPAVKVQVLHSHLFTHRPTPDNAQVGLLFENKAIANIFASFCIDDGDFYRDGLTLNFENGTIYRNVGPRRGECDVELSLVMARGGKREIVAQSEMMGRPGAYQWDAFARAVGGEKLKNATTPADIVAGLRVVEAMARADAGNGVADVGSTHAN